MENDLNERWRALWAKSDPYHSLWKHLLDTAAVSQALRNPVANDGWSSAQLALVVGMHDIGKADPVFQHQVEAFSADLVAAGFAKTADAPVRHDKLSAHFVREHAADLGLDLRVADAVSRAIGAHHGLWEEDARACPTVYEQAREALFTLLRTVLGAERLPSTRPANLSAFGIRLAGHIVLCDWIASNECFFADPRLAGQQDPVEYATRAREVASDWVFHYLQLGPDTAEANPTGVVDHPRGIQQTLLDQRPKPGLVVIEAPMGDGKTEAAWILAEQWRQRGHRGVYMALPTQATSDSLYGRYRKDYLDRLGRAADVKLVHGMAWLRDGIEPELLPIVGQTAEDRELAAAWFRPTRRALLAAHGVGTVDQCLLAALNAKFGFLRLYGLDGRVLVVDEVHAYDAYMNAILQRLMAWCSALRIPVVLLSATLSATQRAGLLAAYGAMGSDPGPDAPYPLVTMAAPNEAPRWVAAPASSARTLTISPHPGLLGDAEATARLAESLVMSGGSACVIANTVRQAQAVFGALKLPAHEKGLFHARFTAGDRATIANCVTARFGRDTTQRPSRYVLVATQVVEQSLDVDFDFMVSDIAPIDLLLQRSGRMHRHRARQSDPELHILLPQHGTVQFGGAERVYDRYILLRTLAMVTTYQRVRLPEQFRELIEACYGEGPIPDGIVAAEDLAAARQQWEEDTMGRAIAAAPFLLNKPSVRTFRPVENNPVGDDSDDGNGWRASTRLGAHEHTCVLMPAAEAAKLAHGALPRSAIRDLYRRAVRVPHYVQLQQPDDGYETAKAGERMLRGLTFVPTDGDGYWRSASHSVHYDKQYGLIVETRI